jgi:hypothetical protein
MTTQYVSGGDLLNKRLGEIARKLRKASSVRVGFLEGATYSNGTSVAQVAAIMDFGAPAAGIPPRPFFRNMVAEKSPEWPDAIEKLIASEDYDSDKILKLVGEGIAGQLRQSIRDFDSVPLKPATIKRKGFDKQLVDTGVLLASVDYEVKGTS